MIQHACSLSVRNGNVCSLYNFKGIQRRKTILYTSMNYPHRDILSSYTSQYTIIITTPANNRKFNRRISSWICMFGPQLATITRRSQRHKEIFYVCVCYHKGFSEQICYAPSTTEPNSKGIVHISVGQIYRYTFIC
jgi:hypothetical protein